MGGAADESPSAVGVRAAVAEPEGAAAAGMRRLTVLVNGDDAGLAAWRDVLEVALLAEDPTCPLPRLPELAAQARAQSGPHRSEFWLMRVDGAPAGGYRFVLPVLDNLGLVEMHLGIHPDHQHRGHGRALLEHALARAGVLGRHQLVAETDEAAPGSGGAGSASRGARFATAAGFARGLVAVRRVLDLLHLDQTRLDRLRGEATAAADGYEVLGWTGACPDELVDGYAALVARMSTDAPSGDLDIEPEVWDADRVRQVERLYAALGRVPHASVARRGSDGVLVGYSEVLTKIHDPDNVFQQGTLVVREDRGHRLGMLVKLATLDRLRAAAPAARWLYTANAEENRWMVAINDALGFRVAAYETAWRRDI
jgi:GNAT superfamily N-acetyltransferase